MHIHRFLFLFSLVSVTLPAWSADTLYRVTDPYGNVTYQDQPPPEGSNYLSEPVGTDQALSAKDDKVAVSGQRGSVGRDKILALTEERPLVLFSVPDCDACDFVRWFLERRDLPFEEVDVKVNINNQIRLNDATGEYRVPVLMVGDEPVFGFDSDTLTAALSSAGYIKTPIDNGPAEKDVNQETPATPEVN